MEIILYIGLIILFGTIVGFIIGDIFDMEFKDFVVISSFISLVVIGIFLVIYLGPNGNNRRNEVSRNRAISITSTKEKCDEGTKDTNKNEEKYIEKVKYDLDIKGDEVLKQDKFILVIDEKKIELKINVDTVKYIKDSSENPYLLLNKISNEENTNTKYELLEVHY